MDKKSLLVSLIVVIVLGAGFLPGAQDRTARTVKLRVSAEQANLREKPDIGSAVVQQIPEGTVLEADKKEGEWYLVRYTLEDGGVIAGYIHESLVVVLDQSQIPGAQTGRAVKPERKSGSEGRGLPAAERKASWFESALPVDVFISAGGSTIVADDFNKGAQGLADYNAALLGIGTIVQADRTTNSLRLTYLLGIEVFYRVNPWLSIGLGVDYLKGWRSSRVDYPTGDSGLLTPYTAARPSVQAVPVKLSVRFYPRPDFYIRGSCAYYIVKAGYDYRFVPSEVGWQEWKGRATAHTLGMEVAAGGEWGFTANLLLFAEAGFRLARLNGFSGTGTYRDSVGTNTTEQGPLWYYQELGADARGYNLLFVHSAEPSGTNILAARKAGINLTGTALKAGIKFRF
jgi:hypothetical protein